MKEENNLTSNQEILGGLKSAVERGESLKDAMMTFYQAGYDKYEIEEAARSYMNQQNTKTPTSSSEKVTPPVKTEEKIEGKSVPIKPTPLPPIKPAATTLTTPRPVASENQNEQSLEREESIRNKVLPPIKPAATIPTASNLGAPASPKTKPLEQKASAYGATPEGQIAGKTLTIALTFILIFLIGILAAVFLFKGSLVDFFNNLFP